MRVHSLTRRPHEDDGAVAVFVAILAVVLIALAAFAVDIGNAYANKRQLSVTADAAALAAAAKVGAALTPGQACTPGLLTTINATSLATTEANAYAAANSKSGTSAPMDSVTVACAGSDAVDVTVANSRAVKTVLAGVIGFSSLQPNATATARITKQPSGGGLRPWAICNSVIDEAAQDKSTTYWTGLDNQEVGVCGTTAAGNWGGVDFNGGNNAAGDLASWTLNGYPGAVDIPDPLLPADPGVSGSSALDTAFASLVGQVILLPSVSAFNPGGNGNNASFNAVGVATVKVCGIYYANTEYKTGSDCWVNPLGSPGQVAVTPVEVKKNDTKLTATTDSFDSSMVGKTIVVTGADNGNQDLTTTIAAVVNARTITLADKAGQDLSTTTAYVSTTVAGFVPLLSNGKPINHIQFRYQAFVSTFSQSGVTSQPCSFTRFDCVTSVQLWG